MRLAPTCSLVNGQFENDSVSKIEDGNPEFIFYPTGLQTGRGNSTDRRWIRFACMTPGH